jgi:Putative adhesin
MRNALITTGFVTLLAAAGCDSVVGFDQARQDFHYSYALEPGGRLEIRNMNGSVEISGWDRNNIDVSGTKYAPTEERLKDIEIKVNVTGNEAVISTELPYKNFYGPFGAHYVIRVPRRIQVDRAHTTNGSISVENLEGNGELRSTNGRVTLARSTGDFRIQTTNGSIDIEDANGLERAQTTNGGIHGTLKSGAIEAESTNGAIELSVGSPASDRPLRLATTNGAVKLTLNEFHANPISTKTTHGSVTLRLPGNINAKLDAHTSFAHISNEFALTSTEEQSKHELKGQIGKGGPLISASTSSGRINIQRY